MVNILLIMNEEHILSKEEARVLDILEQIKRLNNLIDTHREIDRTSAHIQQYEELKDDFLLELTTIFSQYQLGITKLSNQAA
jgi:hypothetical protein